MVIFVIHSCLVAVLTVQILINFVTHPGGASGYNGPYRGAPPERGTFSRLEVYERVGISLVEVYETGRKICHFNL